MDDKFMIFVVDDEPIFLEMLKDELAEDLRLDVHAYSSGEECLDNIYLHPDVVILDHNLSKSNPDAKDGMEVLEEIQRQIPDVVIIILTGQIYPHVTFDYIMEKDVYKYIVKGETAFDDLKEAIDIIIQKKSG